MQVSVEKTDKALERKLRIQVPADRFEREVVSRLRKVSKGASIKGFRPGKVPMAVIEQQYGQQVRNEALSEVISSTYSEAVMQEKLRPAGNPQIADIKAEEGADIEYSATVELYPEFDLADFGGLVIDRTVVEIAVADVDRMIENLRKQRATWNPVERAAADGDEVTVDFEGKLDGEVFPGGAGKDVKVVIGEGRFLAQFETNLVGALAGDTREFDLPFPDDYSNASLAGKTAQFSAAVKVVSEQSLPVVDDEFCAGFGVEEGGVERLRTDVQANMQAELDQALRRKVKLSVLEALRAANPIELPGALVKDELQRVKMEALQRMGAANNKDMPDLPDELFQEQAERRVALGLLISEVIRRQEIKLDQARLHTSLMAIADTYDEPQKVVDAYRRNRQLMDGLQAMTMEEQVVDHILDHAKVTDVTATFNEVMNAR